MTLARFAGLIQASGKQYQLASQSDATFTDLQKGPAILVGLMNNSWTERLVPQLRFTVEHPAPNLITIRDRQNPLNKDWSIDYSSPYLNVTNGAECGAGQEQSGAATIVTIRERGERFKRNDCAPGVFAEWKRLNRSFTDPALWGDAGYNLSGAGQQLPESVRAATFSWNMLPTLGVQPALLCRSPTHRRNWNSHRTGRASGAGAAHDIG